MLGSKPIGANTSLLECARRADGAAAVIVASSSFVERELGPVPEGGGGGAGSQRSDVVVLAGGEASGPLYPPAVIDEEMFSCEEAAARAMATAQLWPEDIDFFGLYDCFPICFLRAVEAVGLAEKGGGGDGGRGERGGGGHGWRRCTTRRWTRRRTPLTTSPSTPTEVFWRSGLRGRHRRCST